MHTADTYNDKVVLQFSVMTVVWGIVGMLVGLFIAAQLYWPALNFDLPCCPTDACARCIPMR